MKRAVFVCVLLGVANSAFGQEAICPSTVPGLEAGCPPCAGCRCEADGLAKFLPCDEPTTREPFADVPDCAANRLHHLLQAAAHLAAAGETEGAESLRQLAERERRALLERLAALEAEVYRLREAVGQVPQILVQVRLIELSRTKLRRLGIDLAKLQAPGSANATGDAPCVVLDGTGRILSIGPAGACRDAPFAVFLADDAERILGFLRTLCDDGLAKVLAEPRLVTLSGRPAVLHVGGQYPVPVPHSNGTTAVELKEFGTRLNVVATALGNGRLRLELRPEVTDLDTSQRSEVDGQVVYGLRTRALDVGVEMQSGQTMVIAGLVQQRAGSSRSEPQKADCQKSASSCDEPPEDTDEETELIVLVRPEIVASAVPTTASFPVRGKTR